MKRVIDLRSDTVTKPSPEMRKIIATAEVGDDVFNDDPTVKKLEEAVASRLGKEAALYVPSGTMANQVSLRSLCNAGDEVICERGSHIVNSEAGAASALSGVMLTPIDSENGRPAPKKIAAAIRSNDIHNPNTKLIALENTNNRAGGAVLDLEYIAEVEKIARERGLGFYLDGARLWNAATSLGVKPAQIAGPFDLVSVCFSKGLGAPIGSAVCGNRELITKARRIRKMLGGGMRQVGIIASAALYALQNNYDRLKDDHVRAKKLARSLDSIEGININLDSVQSNIILFKPELPVTEFLERAAEKGLLMVPFGIGIIRAVTHLDVDDEDIDGAIEIIADVASSN